MEFLRRKRTKPPIEVHGPPTLHTVKVELNESWVQTRYNGAVLEERKGASYRWKPQLVHGYRLGLVGTLNNIPNVHVSGGSIDSIDIHVSGELTNRTLDTIRQRIEMAEAASISMVQKAHATS